MPKKTGDPEIINPVRPLRIDITQEDINNGKPLDPNGCAAAQCILRSTKAVSAAVHRGVTYLTIGNKVHRYRTSSALRMETIIFDRGGTFIPGEYDLMPVPISALGITTRKKKSPSAPRTTREANRATRRMTIPGVRRTARETPPTEE